jgi:hypothetical protein
VNKDLNHLDARALAEALRDSVRVPLDAKDSHGHAH